MRKTTTKKYKDKLKDPRWQKKRLEVFERDEWRCQGCGSTEITLHVHHKVYRGDNPWEAQMTDLLTLCESCHEFETWYRTEIETHLLQTLRKAGFLTEHLHDLAFLLQFKRNSLSPNNIFDYLSYIVPAFYDAGYDRNDIAYFAEKDFNEGILKELFKKIRKERLAQIPNKFSEA